MKKKLLIVSHALELGGAERSLIGLLDALGSDDFEIDLFLLRHQGELMDAIPAHVRLLEAVPAYTVLARPMKDTLREGHVLLTGARIAGKLAAKRFNKRHGYAGSDAELEYSHKFTCPLMPRIQPQKEYDLAVSFLTPHYFVAQKVRAKKKIAWIHTDYSRIRIDVDSETRMWSAYDHIATISDSVSKGFLSVFPGLKDKLVLIRNILPGAFVARQAEAFSAEEEMPPRAVRLLSVGRYCEAKNFDNVPDICARLADMGHDVVWYIIGFGPDEQMIRECIEKAGMQERVILLGKKENPYPYIRACDLYVQPSRYEGNCVTVREAQMLGRPVVITRYATSASQLEEDADGVIVPMDNEGCAAGIAALLKNPEKMARLAQTCVGRDYTNAAESGKLRQLID